MKKVNLQSIIENYELDPKEIAKDLFPDNKYPDLAMKRILSGEAYLDTNQVSKLALLIGVPIETLYSGGQWKGKRVEATHIFSHGDYRAELNLENQTTKVFHKDSLFHDEMLHSGSISISEYLEQLDNLILNHKTN